MGGIQKRICLVEHPQGMDVSQKRQVIAQDAGGYIKHPDPGHWMQPDSTNNQTGGGKKEARDKTLEYGQHQGFHPAPLLTA